MKRQVRFDAVAVGQEFKAFDDGNGHQGDAVSVATTLTKRSGSSAGTPSGDIVRFRPAQLVTFDDGKLPPTPESIEQKELLRLERGLEYDVQSATEGAAKFAADVVKDFAHAMEWSDGYFDVAGRGHVARIALHVLDVAQEKSLDPMGTLLDEARSLTFRGARYPHHSTSMPSNRQAEAIVAAWAQLYENVSDRLGRK